MKIIFLGLPGSGKTTLGRKLAAELGIMHVSVGSEARRMLHSGEDFADMIHDEWQRAGGPQPLSDEIAQTIALWAIAGKDAWVLDGFPRTAGQAHFLPSIDAVIYLLVPDEICIDRMNQRARPGETESPQQRLAIDADRLPALLDYVRERWPVHEIDGSRSLEDVWQDLYARICGG